nr:hypothetical protein [Tanacetum cinerariifolium]
MRQAWFIASVDFTKGLVDQDGIDETMFGKSHRVLVEEEDGVLNSEGDGVAVLEKTDVVQQTGNVSTTELFVEFHALKVQVEVIKKHKVDEVDDLTNRFLKLESSQTFVLFERDRMEIDRENGKDDILILSIRCTS